MSRNGKMKPTRYLSGNLVNRQRHEGFQRVARVERDDALDADILNDDAFDAFSPTSVFSILLHNSQTGNAGNDNADNCAVDIMIFYTSLLIRLFP
jgi:hypothetical protein